MQKFQFFPHFYLVYTFPIAFRKTIANQFIKIQRAQRSSGQLVGNKTINVWKILFYTGQIFFARDFFRS